MIDWRLFVPVIKTPITVCGVSVTLLPLGGLFEPHQRMAKVDDLLQSRTKQIDLVVVTGK